MKFYKSPAYAVVHQCMEDIVRNGGASKESMREFDEMCLFSQPFIGPEAIKNLRLRMNLSQSVFARYLTEKCNGK